jgi:hypothetical protein
MARSLIGCYTRIARLIQWCVRIGQSFVCAAIAGIRFLEMKLASRTVVSASFSLAMARW